MTAARRRLFKEACRYFKGPLFRGQGSEHQRAQPFSVAPKVR